MTSLVKKVQVEAWQTSDGKAFPTKELAWQHEARTQLEKMIHNDRTFVTKQPEQMADFILRNSSTIVNLLLDIKEDGR